MGVRPIGGGVPAGAPFSRENDPDFLEFESFLELGVQTQRTEGSFTKNRVVDTICDNRNKDLYDLLYHGMPSNCSTHALRSPEGFIRMKQTAYWFMESKAIEEGYWATNNCVKMREQEAFAAMSKADQRCACWFTKTMIFANQVHIEVSDRLRGTSELYRMGLFSPELNAGSSNTRLAIIFSTIAKVSVVVPLASIVFALMFQGWMGKRITKQLSVEEMYGADHWFVLLPFYCLLAVGVGLVGLSFGLRILAQNVATHQIIFDEAAAENRGYFKAEVVLTCYLAVLGCYNMYYAVMFFKFAKTGLTVKIRVLSDAMLKATLAVSVVKAVLAMLQALIYRDVPSWTNRLYLFLQKQNGVRIRELQRLALGRATDNSASYDATPDEVDYDVPILKTDGQKPKTGANRILGILGSASSPKLVLSKDGGSTNQWTRRLQKFSSLVDRGSATEYSINGSNVSKSAKWVTVFGITDDMLMHYPTPRSSLKSPEESALELAGLGDNDPLETPEAKEKKKAGSGLMEHVCNATNIGVEPEDMYMFQPAVTLGVLSFYCEGIFASSRVESISQYMSTALILMSGVQVSILNLLSSGSSMGKCSPPLLDYTQFNASDCAEVYSDYYCKINCRSNLPPERMANLSSVLKNYNRSGNETVESRNWSITDASFNPGNVAPEPGLMYCNRGRLQGELPTCICPVPPYLTPHDKFDVSDCYAGMPVGGKCEVECRYPYTGTPRGYYCNSNGTFVSLSGNTPMCTVNDPTRDSYMRTRLLSNAALST